MTTSPTHAVGTAVVAALRGAPVDLLGGSETAWRCAVLLQQAGCHLTVIAAELTPALEDLVALDPAVIHSLPSAPRTTPEPALIVDATPDPQRPASSTPLWLSAADLLGADTASDAAATRAALRGARPGSVALVGGGPGDPGLLTRRGYELLHAADVVVTDRLGPVSVLAELGEHVEIIDASKVPYGRFMPQEEINAHLIAHARAGKFVVRLKGGDPYLFGRGFEEVLALREAGIEVEEVPGIPSAFAAPASVGIPVTHRGVNHEMTVISGHVPPGHPTSLTNYAALAQTTGTLVILMGVKNAPAITQALIDGGRPADQPAAAIHQATTSHARTVYSTLGNLVEDMQSHGIVAPAVIVIGDVCGVGRS